MVRFSFALLALAGIASTSAAVVDASQSHNSRGVSGAHKKMMKVRSLSPVPLPSNSTSDAEMKEVVQQRSNDGKRDDNARFTFFNTEVGEGACGAWSKNTDYIVALNSDQFGNGENCWKMIGIWVDGKQIQAQIVDECPGCPYRGLDMTPTLFQFFSELGAGVLYGDWWFA